MIQELIGYIHDSCPSCPKYHWDLSDYMYLDLTSEQSVGKKIVSITTDANIRILKVSRIFLKLK